MCPTPRHAVPLLIVLVVVFATACANDRETPPQDPAQPGTSPSPAASDAAPGAPPSLPAAPAQQAVRGLAASELAGRVLASAARAIDGAQPTSLAAVRERLVRAARDEDAITALRLLLAGGHLEPDAERAARFVLGKLEVRAGDPAALETLSALPAPLEPVEDLRLAWLARAQVLAGRHHEALDSARELLRRFPRSDEVYAMRILAAQSLALGGDTEAADALLARNHEAGTRVPRPLRAETLRARVEIWQPRDPALAARYARTLLVEHPAEAATRRPRLPLGVEALSDAERFERADRLQRDWSYPEAREEFRRLMEHPRLGYEASWNVAEISGRWYRDDTTGARAIYESLEKRRGPYREKLRFRILQTWLAEWRYDEAAKIVATFPRSGFGLYYRGWIPYRTRDCATARPWLRAYADAERDSTVRGFEAWCEIREGRWQQAVERFEALVPPGNPIVRGKAYYWQAFALHALSRTDEARERLARLHAQYPLTWYDVLAYQMEARWDGRDARASVVLAPLFEGAGQGALLDEALESDAAWDWPRLAPALRAQLDTVRRLVELDELERARAAYAPIRDRVEKSVPAKQRWAFVHFMGHRTGNHYHGWEKASGSVRAMSSERPDGTDPRWLVAYPRAYRTLVEAVAHEFSIPPELVWSIMLQESRFRWYQVSSWEAIGALQMIPQTAESVAADLGLVWDRHTFSEPRAGFRYSAYYMSRHFALWKNLALTAASYNGGPLKVQRWMQDARGAPLDVLVEEFSFDQSRHYCRKVMEHMLRYLYLYEPDPRRRGELLDLMFPLEVDYDIPDDVGY